VAGRRAASGQAPVDTGRPFNVADAYARLNLRARVAGLAVGALSSIADRHRFVRPRLNDSAVALGALHAWWRQFRRVRFGGRHDHVVAWTDLVAHAASFGLVSAAAAEGDQFDVITNWIFTVTLFDLTELGLILGGWEASLIGALTAALYTTFTLRKARSVGVSLAIANGAQILIFAASGIAIGHVARRGEAEAEAINARYRAERAEAARQSEIDVARRHLIRSVQAAAIDIGDLLAHDRLRARQVSAAIATQLRAVLSEPDDVPSVAFRDAVLGAVVAAAVDGLVVETTFRIDTEVEPSLMDALVAALSAALRNITDHANTDRAVLRVVADPRYVQMTLRDRGHGRNGLQATDLRSVLAALGEVRGVVEVRSSSEQGTRIRIAVPT
jgi:hypothetical protein